jgi:superfamily I DNA/RNA helicase/Zn-dependent peptidase ImmA (M78 family)
MDSFEPIRQAAAALREELVAADVDPFRPLDLVKAAVEKREIELTFLVKGHTALKGARALYDEQSGAIVCEAVTDDGEAAQLVAHELGHVLVHAAQAVCSSDDIDVSRSTECAPVGLQRVEDYGAHERRELQANVFAREFLLPRGTARRLYLEEKSGAAAIAARTGLNKNLVRQQMFDALLMPVPRNTEDLRAARPSRDDPSQRTAALHRGTAFQLQAGPGTGKTRTLEMRVRSLLDEDVDPASILILTFSNRAAGELAERLAVSAADAAARIWIGTFHAFGLDMIRRYHDRLGLPADPTLFDRSDAIEVLEEILPTLPLVHYRNLWDPAMVLRDIVAAISRAKDEMTDHVRYRALAEKMAAATDEETRTAGEKAVEVGRVYEAYQKAILDRGAVDFGDLIMRPTLLLESDSDIRAAAQLRHRHILVDEYQDVNRASGRFLRAMAGNGARLWVVGDARQSIYRFRGASSSNMTAFATEYPDANADQLAVNYRSTDEIVRTLVAMAPQMGASKGMIPLAFESDRGPGPSSIEVRHFDTPDDESAGIAATIRELEARGVGLRDQAVLCRSNRRLNEIAGALEDRGIPVLHLGSLFEREEIRDLLALLTLAVDRFGDGLARIGAMPRYGMSLQDVRLATSYLRTKSGRALISLPELGTIPGISESGAQGLARLAADLDGLSASASAWDYLAQYLLDRSEFIRQLTSEDEATDQMRGVAVWQFLNFVRERSPTTGGHPIQRTLDRVRQLVLLAEERDLRQVPAGALHLNAVRLMTVHGSKGLEFEAVHVPSLTAASFPVYYRPPRCPAPAGMIEGAEDLTATEEARASQTHEEQCLFFVACSRARSFLRLSGTRSKPSPYLQWIPPALSAVISNPAVISVPKVPIDMKPVPASALAELTEARLSLYEKCPLRFFYTHILGLGNARKPTAFTRTHDCLYAFMKWLAESRSKAEPTLVEAEAQFDEIWKEEGPVSHAFAGDYRSLASRLISTLLESGANRSFRNAEPLAIDFSTGRIWVRPSERADLPDGTVILRRIHTGKKRSDEYDRLTYTLYHLAGESNFGSGFSVEAVHLTDGIMEPVEITSKKLANRKAKGESIVQKIAAGAFPPDPDPVSCPRCPHFFICAALPAGNLSPADQN